MMWFQYSLNRIYNPSVISIQGQPIDLRIIGGLFAWILLAIGINFFVLQDNVSKYETFIRGLLFGFIVYGVYNGTLYAIFSNYDSLTFFSDLTWGTLATGLSSVIVTYI